MTKRKSNKFFTYVKKWHIVAAAVVVTFGSFLYISNAVRGYVEGVADDIVREKLAAYPPPDGLKKISQDIESIKGDVADTKMKIEGIDQFLRGAKIK